MEAPDECANCGAAIPRGAKSCPECGADERTGWRETSIYDGLDLPDESEGEQTRRPVRRVNGLAWYWWAIGVLVIILLIAGRWLV
jgi:predicted nucleic acid-binding Zn ribbon protein